MRLCRLRMGVVLSGCFWFCEMRLVLSCLGFFTGFMVWIRRTVVYSYEVMVEEVSNALNIHISFQLF